MTKRFAARCLAGGLLVLVAVFTIVGCGKPAKKTGTVSGTVTYNSKPVTSGSVVFHGVSGQGAQGKIDTTGHYKLEVPIDEGEYKVYILPPIPGMAGPPPDKDKKASPPPKFDLPQKFRDMNTSGATASVKAGDNDIPITLKD